MKWYLMRCALGTLLASALLTACAGAPADQEPVAVDLLPDLDVEETDMSPEDYQAFSRYLPVLRGEETFRWVQGPYDDTESSWEPFDADMAVFRDRLWSDLEQTPPETLTLDRLAVADLDGDGGAELALLFQDRGYHYLLLRSGEEGICGTSLPIRWFEDLQTNGVYIGSGGAGSSWYHRMTFQDGVFVQQELGHREEWGDGGTYELDGRAVTQADFDAWLEEEMSGSVTWHAPDGAKIPEGM